MCDKETDGTVILLPPQNIKAEQFILGGVLKTPDAMNKVADIVGPADFYRDSHSKIYEIMFDLHCNSDTTISVSSVSGVAHEKGILDSIGGVAYLNTLVDVAPKSADIAHYAKMIREKALLRRLMNAATDIIEKGWNEDANVNNYDAVRMIKQIAKNACRPCFWASKNLVTEIVERIAGLWEKEQPVTGVPTGFAILDKLIDGLHNSDLTIVAGRPSMGKTAFCMNIAKNVATIRGNSHPVAIFSLEVSKEELITRLLTSESEIELSKLKSGMLSPSEWPRLAEAASNVGEAFIYIDDSQNLSILELCARASRLRKEAGLELIVIDYLQLMRGWPVENRCKQDISEILQSLKTLAKELSIPIIAISELDGEPEGRDKEDRRPKLVDLHESGIAEEDADVIMFIYRDEMYNKDNEENKGVVEIIVEKQTNGHTGVVKLEFIDKSMKFRDLYRR